MLHRCDVRDGEGWRGADRTDEARKRHENHGNRGSSTGINIFTAELTAKRLDLLRELVPGAAHVGVLVNPANAKSAESTLRDMAATARTAGLQIKVLNASNGLEIEAAFASLLREMPDAPFVATDAYFFTRRVQLSHLATRHKIAATYSQREFAEAG